MRQPAIFVELMTPERKVFSGAVSAVEFSPSHGVVQMGPGDISYFGAVETGEVSLRIGKRFRFFTLLHASASVNERRLTVIAEDIQLVPSPLREGGNPSCKCDDDPRSPKHRRSRKSKL